MKNLVLLCLITIVFSTLLGCSVADDIKDTFDAVECANLIAKISDDDNMTCADTIADIKKIEKSCGEFLTEESKEQIAFIKANCTDD